MVRLGQLKVGRALLEGRFWAVMITPLPMGGKRGVQTPCSLLGLLILCCLMAF